MKKYFTLGLLLLVFNYCYAQEPVVDRNVEEDREAAATPDRMKTQLKWGYNLTLDVEDSLKTKWSSASIGIGRNFILRPAKFYSIGITYGVQFDNFKIEQDSANLLSPLFINDKQQLSIYTVRIGLQNRFHLGKHGIKEGAYIEIGAAASAKLTSRMRIQNDIDPKLASSQGGEKSDLLVKRLKYTELIGYYATAAIGRNGLSLYGEYRFSNLFKKFDGINGNRKFPEIAPLNVGLRLEF